MTNNDSKHYTSDTNTKQGSRQGHQPPSGVVIKNQFVTLHKSTKYYNSIPTRSQAANNSGLDSFAYCIWIIHRLPHQGLQKPRFAVFAVFTIVFNKTVLFVLFSLFLQWFLAFSPPQASRQGHLAPTGVAINNSTRNTSQEYQILHQNPYSATGSQQEWY